MAVLTQICNPMLTLEHAIRQTEASLSAAGLYYGHGTDNAWDEAVWLVLHCMGRSPQVPLHDLDEILPAAVQTRLAQLLAARIETRKPLAYLLQSAWFAGHEFYVDERVLVPRSPLAELIEQDFSPWLPRAPRKLLDLCTGSGCIAIACAHRFPQAEVHGGELSESALEVAALNVRRHELGARVHLFQSDLFAQLPVVRYDLIVCNPPYVDAVDMRNLPPEYRHEPVMGLAAGSDGLQIVRRLLAQAGDFLSAQGLLIVEVGNSAEALLRVYPRLPFTWIEFECGGEGVFVLTVGELNAYKDILVSKKVG